MSIVLSKVENISLKDFKDRGNFTKNELVHLIDINCFTKKEISKKEISKKTISKKNVSKTIQTDILYETELFNEWFCYFKTDLDILYNDLISIYVRNKVVFSKEINFIYTKFIELMYIKYMK